MQKEHGKVDDKQAYVTCPKTRRRRIAIISVRASNNHLTYNDALYDYSFTDHLRPGRRFGDIGNRIQTSRATVKDTTVNRCSVHRSVEKKTDMAATQVKDS